jgi:hypothetical protein
MKSIAKFLAIGVFAAATTLSAHANTISFTIYDGATVIGTGTSATGVISLSGSDSAFSVSGSAIGSPTLNAPNLSTQSFSISDTSGAAATLTISITETGLTTGAGAVMNTFALNSLLGGGFSSANISNYYSSSNVPFGEQYLLGSATYSGHDSFSSAAFGSIGATGTYSETSVYTLTYAQGATGTVSASDQIISTTPEPNSLVLLGTGLASAAGVVFRKRRSIA